MNAYIIHFDLDSFIAQADTTGVGDEPIYVTHMLEMHELHGMPANVGSVIVATYTDVGQHVHAARIVVERASLLGDRDQIAERVRERAMLALDTLEARLPGPIQRYAIQLAPGLYEDLKRFETAHGLWRWEDVKDPIGRRLIPNT